jgi:hypothetical protein
MSLNLKTLLKEGVIAIKWSSTGKMDEDLINRLRQMGRDSLISLYLSPDTASNFYNILSEDGREVFTEKMSEIMRKFSASFFIRSLIESLNVSTEDCYYVENTLCFIHHLSKKYLDDAIKAELVENFCRRLTEGYTTHESFSSKIVPEFFQSRKDDGSWAITRSESIIRMYAWNYGVGCATETLVDHLMRDTDPCSDTASIIGGKSREELAEMYRPQIEKWTRKHTSYFKTDEARYLVSNLLDMFC